MHIIVNNHNSLGPKQTQGVSRH